MALKKSLLIAGVISTIGLATITATNAASASSNQDSLIEKIASKFNLNKDEVKQVFDEYKDEHRAERQARLSEDLQSKVDSGKITAEQKTLIENKQKELEAAREAEHEQTEKWAEENNIDMKYLRMGGPRGNSDRLQNAVDSGKITAEQKTLIENKQKELKEKHETLRNDLKQWAEDNNLELEDIMAFGHGKGHGHRGSGMMR